VSALVKACSLQSKQTGSSVYWITVQSVRSVRFISYQCRL